MKAITRQNISEIKSELNGKVLVLYGAATAGRQVLELLSDLKISADFFVDDDAGKHGKIIEGLKCLSFDELKNLSQNNNVAVILSSIFSGSILEKLKTISVDCYEIYDMLYTECVNSSQECLSMKQDKNSWNEKWQSINNILQDEESKRVWQLMRYVADTKKVVKEKFMEICSGEEHYFVEPVKNLLNEKSVLVDCGAYTGDMLGQLTNNKIAFGKIYEIEANPFHKEKILEKISVLNLENKVVVMNCGLFDKDGELNFFINNGNLAGSRIVNPESENNLNGGGQIVKIPSKRLDDIITDKIDFFKTDIEGAEMPALRGAKNLLVNSRPILAISIYHSLDDVVDIPCYLNDLLANYKFFVKHHSFNIDETVLYGIPCERIGE